MPRSIWNGTITFGLIGVPIKVTSATEDKAVHFHQVHASDGARIEQHRMCAREGTEVPYKDVAKGYEVAEGEYVLLSNDEIAAAAGENSHRIALEEFVCAADIDPVFYARTYYLAPGKDGEAPYRLVHDALARSDRVGIGRWVFHNREYLVALRSLEDVLALHTMHFAAELVPASDLELAEPSRAPGDREIEMAEALVESLHAPFELESFTDAHREKLLELIERKARGEDAEPEPVADPEPAADLLAALEASLGQHGSGSGGRGAAKKRSSTPKRGSSSSSSKSRAKARG